MRDKERIDLLEKKLENLGPFLDDPEFFDKKLVTINDLIDKATNPDIGLEAKMQQINIAQKEAEAVASLKDDIETIQKQSLQQLGEISGAVLSRNFGNRANELKTSVEKWHARFLGSIVCLTIFALVAAIWQYKLPESFLSFGLFVKSLITAPVAIYTAFSGTQYGREKRLLEEYEFKSAVSLSLDAHRTIIKQDIDAETQKDYVQFIISEIAKIYIPPTETIKQFTHSLDKSVIPPDAFGILRDQHNDK